MVQYIVMVCFHNRGSITYCGFCYLKWINLISCLLSRKLILSDTMVIIINYDSFISIGLYFTYIDSVIRLGLYLYMMGHSHSMDNVVLIVVHWLLLSYVFILLIQFHSYGYFTFPRFIKILWFVLYSMD